MSWDKPGASPTGALWTAQYGLVGELFHASMEWLDPRRVVVVAGRDYWRATAEQLGLADLPPQPTPLIAAGRRHARTYVAAYHPSARLRVMTQLAFADAVLAAVTDPEA